MKLTKIAFDKQWTVFCRFLIKHQSKFENVRNELSFLRGDMTHQIRV